MIMFRLAGVRSGSLYSKKIVKIKLPSHFRSPTLKNII